MTAGFEAIVAHEDFYADPLTYIPLKPEESDLNYRYITEFELYSQRFSTSLIYIATTFHIF